MASLAATFTTEVSRQLKHLTAWPPGIQLSLGSVGEIGSDHIFDPISDLSSFGIHHDVVEGDTKTDPFSYKSKGVKDFGVSGGAEVPKLGGYFAEAKAKVTIEFEREHAIVFHAGGLKDRRIADQPKLAMQMVELLDQGLWNSNWFVITSAVEAEAATILISNSSASRVDLALGVDANVAGMSLLSAEFEPRLVSEKEMGAVFVGRKGMTPLFKAKRIRKKWFDLFGEYELRASYSANTADLSRDLDGEDFADELLEEVGIYDAI